jgi:hypothetical protein
MSYSCPHCRMGGSANVICKTCNTIMCTSCKKTVQGVVYKKSSSNICPICKSANNLYYVDYGKSRASL